MEAPTMPDEEPESELELATTAILSYMQANKYKPDRDEVIGAIKDGRISAAVNSTATWKEAVNQCFGIQDSPEEQGTGGNNNNNNNTTTTTTTTQVHTPESKQLGVNKLFRVMSDEERKSIKAAGALKIDRSKGAGIPTSITSTDPAKSGAVSFDSVAMIDVSKIPNFQYARVPTQTGKVEIKVLVDIPLAAITFSSAKHLTGRAKK
jgi:hypothetical protein